MGTCRQIGQCILMCAASLLWPALSLSGGHLFGGEKPIDFNRDVRQILSDNCFACHGPDAAQRASDLRLDVPEIAVQELESGVRAIVPGKPEESEFVRRILSEDEFEKMPPADSHKKLSTAEIELLRRWIAEGAPYEQHWAFRTPVRPAIPTVPASASDENRIANPIDAFIFARLHEEGLGPSPLADPLRQLRRASLDLTGLSPSIEELDAFLADTTEDRYERAVDRLLASPRFGEHQARYWLDAARYGDTHGLHLDNIRSMFPYRAYVIQSFNENKPFDQFAVEQVAGDLLPKPTTEQLVATGFGRCNVTTSEGGSIAEEFRVRYAIDRTETLGTVFMGLTVGCAVCHDHKFDPISQKEFFSLYAYYNQADDPAMDGNALLTPPVVKVPSESQRAQKAALEAAIATENAAWKAFVTTREYPNLSPADTTPLPPQREEYVWIDDGIPTGGKAEASGDEYAEGWRWVGSPDHPVHQGKSASYRQARGNRVAQHLFTQAEPLTVGEGDVLFAHVYLDPRALPSAIMLQFNDGTWEHRAVWGNKDAIKFGTADSPGRRHRGDLPPAGEWVRLEVPVADVGLAPGAKLNGWAFTQAGGNVYWDTAGIVTENAARLAASKSLARWASGMAGATGKLPTGIAKILDVAEAERTSEQNDLLLRYFETTVRPQVGQRLDAHEATITKLQGELGQLNSAIPNSLVMNDAAEFRETFVLNRGEYDQPGEAVKPGVPAALPPLPADAPPNRLALAQWLVRPDHPLTARVTVNRIWQHYFGNGLVKTTYDFGLQGESPSHPELLDWLAVEFIESGWDIKHLHRLIVTSHTYRQTSKAPNELVKRDPDNRLLARGPRFRLDAEVIRDMALDSGHLLVEKIGGQSVKPYQPPGLWEAVGYTSSNTAKFTRDSGADLYRRGIYTFWKRTAPPPMLQTFDAPSREACTVLRPRTNTPLQALALMNDVQFVEAARHLASRLLTERDDFESRVTLAFRLLTARPPRPEELALLKETLAAHQHTFEQDPEAAIQLLSEGESPRDESLNPTEFAAWTMIANLLLNMDETVTKN